VCTCDGQTHEIPKRWDMIIAFPPCTFLSNAGARFLYPKGILNRERYAKGIKAKEFFMRFYNADCDKIAIENPVSSTVYGMPKWKQEIEPWMFGHEVTKKTRLWLKGLPLLYPTKIVKPITTYLPAFTSRKDRSKYGSCSRNGNDSVQRSKTFPGIAKAMAEQWAGQDVRPAYEQGVLFECEE